jgi:hypothetical protein
VATDPNTLIPTSQDIAAQGRAAIRAYLVQNKGRATLDGARAIGAQFGLTIDNSAKAAIDWANKKDTDPNLIQINTDVLAGESEPVTVDVVSPEAPAAAPKRSVTDATAEAWREYWANEQLGLDPETLRMFGAEPGNIQGPLGLLNAAILSPVGLARAGLENLEAGLYAGLTGLGQGLENIDIGGRSALQRTADVMSPGMRATPQNFARDFGEFVEVGGLPTIGAPITPRVRAPSPRTAQAPELPPAAVAPIERIAQAPELPSATLPRPRATQADTPRVSPSQRMVDADELDFFTPETQRILTPAKQKEIMAYQTDYANLLAERGISRPKGRTLSEWIQSHMQNETIPLDDLLPVMQRHNITSLEDQLQAAGISRESLSRSGRDLNQASQMQRLLLRAAQENPALAEQLGVGRQAIKESTDIHRRLMGIESGLLTSQLKTTVRNLTGASPQMPAFTLIEELTDAGIRGARNIGRAPEDRLLGPSAADALYAFWDTVGGSLVDAARAAGSAGLRAATRGRLDISPSARALRNQRTIKELRDAFPNQHTKLFGRYASDQVLRGPANTVAGKTLSGLERAVDVANIGNRTVDRWVKNTHFPALLDMELRRVGRSLDEVFDAGTFADIPEPILESAIRRMHKRVFEDRPEGPEWYNQASRSFIDLLNYTARPAGLAPFPNFMVSFGKHVFETNPAAIVRFASKAERRKIADGDARAIGKIAAGLASTLAFYMTKDFDDGTNWFEFSSPEGNVVDVSAAAAPSLPSLWQAYLIHKFNTGTMNEVEWSKDIAKVVGASNMRAGFNGYMVDSGFANIVDAAQRGDSAEEIERMFQRYMTDRAGGWFLFFRTFRDAASATGLQDTTLRSPETPGQAILSNLPFVTDLSDAPERFAPTRAGALQEQSPLFDQFTGALSRGQRNPLEQRLIGLGVAPSTLNRSSGISDTYDRLLTAEVGDIAEKQLLPFLDERAPLGESREKQRLLLKDEYTKIREAAKNRVLRDYPIYRFATEYKKLSRDEKRLADRKNMSDPQRGRSVPEFVREVESIDPAMPVVRKSSPARDIDFAAVPSGAAYADGLTFTVKVKP